MKETLKQLQTKRNRLVDQRKLAQKDLGDIKLDIKKLDSQVKEVTDLIKIKTKSITVSEHAILQFASRYLDLDIENIKALILSDKLLTSTVGFSNGKFPIGEAMGTAVVKENVITTVI